MANGKDSQAGTQQGDNTVINEAGDLDGLVLQFGSGKLFKKKYPC